MLLQLPPSLFLTNNPSLPPPPYHLYSHTQKKVSFYSTQISFTSREIRFEEGAVMAIPAQLYSENHGFPFGGGGGSQDWMENTCASGFNDFCFNLPPKQQTTQHHAQFLNLHHHNTVSLPSNNVKTQLSTPFLAQIDKQNQEIDRFISLQNQRLRLALQEQRKQQLASLLTKYEAKAQFLLTQKDEEIAKALHKTMELENFLRKMEIENQTWQRAAKENEAMVLSLNHTIEQIRRDACLASEAEDAESCCGDVDMNRECGETGTGEHDRGRDDGQEIEEEQITRKKMVCRCCNTRNSCVVFLPCRHICSCEACEAFLDSCPVCGMPKRAKIEALI